MILQESQLWSRLHSFLLCHLLCYLLASSSHCFLLLQEALHDEKADQVAVNFFGDGTANNGATMSSQSYSMQ